MTTIRERAAIVDRTIASLLGQNCGFDDLRVYAPPGVQLRSRPRITICPCVDRGPVTKMSAVCDDAVPDDALVITVDDDIIYNQNWLKTLVEEAERHPDDACGFSGWNVSGFLVDLTAGDFAFVRAPGTCDVLEGYAGVAYRKRWFDAGVLAPPSYARDVDDVWISWQLQRRGIVRRVVAFPMVLAGDNPGLHTHPQFKAKNRRASIALLAHDRIDSGVMKHDHEAIFTPQYEHRSGPGSTPEATVAYRAFLENFISTHGVKSIADFGCGDLEVMSRVNLHGASYLGIDVIAERVRKNALAHPHLSFETADARAYPIPAVDLIVMKDVLQHWDNQEVAAFLLRLVAGPAKMALLTNDNYDEPGYAPRPNADCAVGTWRPLDLTAPPFSIGEVAFVWRCLRDGHVDTKHTVLVRIK